MADTNNSAKINIAVDLIPGDTKELAKVVNTFKNELTSGADLSKYFKYLTKSYTKAIGSLSKPQSTVDKYINGVAIKTAYENMQKINDLRTAAGNKPFEMPEMDFKISGSQIKDIANLTSVLEKMGRTLSKAKTEIDSFSGSIPEMMLSITKAEISRVKKDLKKKSDSDQRELENLLKSGNADKQAMTDALNRYIDSYSQFEALKSGLQGTVKIPKSKYFDELISKASQFGMSSKDMTALLSKAISPDNIGVIQKDLSTMLNNAYRNIDLNYSKIISDSMQSANEKNIEKELSSYIDYINNNIENLRGIKQSIRVDDKTSKKDKITRYQAVIDEAINIAELESLVKSTGAKNINTTKLSASTKAEIDDISQETNMIFDISDELNSVDFSNFTQLDNKSAEELLAIYSQIEDVIKNIQRYNILANGEYGTTFSLESGNDLTIADLMEKQSKIKELAMSQGVEITSFGENVEIAQRVLDNAVRIADGRSLNFFSALAQNIPDISGAIDDETAEVNKSGEELREAVNNASEAESTLSGNNNNSSASSAADRNHLNVDSAANDTTQSFNDKTEAINNEAIAMENAAQREVEALERIKQKVIEVKNAVANGMSSSPADTSDDTAQTDSEEQANNIPAIDSLTEEISAANMLAEAIAKVKTAYTEKEQTVKNVSSASIENINEIKKAVNELGTSIESIPTVNAARSESIENSDSSQSPVSAIRENLIASLNGEQSIPISFIPDIKNLRQQIADELKDIPIEITNNNIDNSISFENITVNNDELTALRNSIKSKLTDVEIQSFKVDSAAEKIKSDLENVLKDVELRFDTHDLQQDIRTAISNNSAETANVSDSVSANISDSTSSNTRRRTASTQSQRNMYARLTEDIKTAYNTAEKFKQEYSDILNGELNTALLSNIDRLSEERTVNIDNSESLKTWISDSTNILNNWNTIKEQIANSLKLAGKYGEAAIASMSNVSYSSKANSSLNSVKQRHTKNLNTEQLNTFNSKLNDIQSHIEQVNNNAENFTAQTVDNIENEIRELDHFGRTMADVNSLEKALTNLSNLRNKLTARNFTGSLVDGQSDSWQNQFNSMEREIRDVINGSSNAAPGSLDTLQNALNRVRESYESLSAAANRGITFSNSSTSVANLNAKFEDLINKMLRFKETNSRISRDSGLSNELDTLISQAQTLGRTPLNLKQVTAQFNSLKNTVMSRGLSGRSLGDEISYIAEKIGLKTVLGGTVYKVIDYLKQMVSVVKELDTGMTTLKRVSTATAEEYSTFFKDAAQSAHDMGSGIKDVVDAAGEFSKLGYSLEEASSLGKSAVTYANVGFMDTASAIESMSSVIQGFKVDAEDAIRVVDRMNIVGNKFAISSKGIGDGLQRAASSLVAAGNDIDESIALITAGNTVLQDPESVANGLKVIGMRLRGAKTELERESEETDGMIESTSKLQDKIKSMTGVDIMSDNDTFKSTYDILLEIANVWEDISDIDQAALLELLAGKNRANVLAAILQSPDVLKSVYDTSVNSAGSAERELETYLDSIEGRMSQLQATFQKLSSDVVGSELVKKIVTIADTALQAVDGLITLGGTFGKIFTGDNDKWAERFDQVKALPTILGAISAAVSVKKGGKADGLLGINYALCLSN